MGNCARAGVQDAGGQALGLTWSAGNEWWGFTLVLSSLGMKEEEEVHR